MRTSLTLRVSMAGRLGTEEEGQTMLSRVRRAVVAASMAAWLMSTAGSLRASDEAATALVGEAAVRALIISGSGDHDWRTSTPWLRQILASRLAASAPAAFGTLPRGSDFAALTARILDL